MEKITSKKKHGKWKFVNMKFSENKLKQLIRKFYQKTLTIQKSQNSVLDLNRKFSSSKN